jgi:hypothetical protein
MKTLKLLEFKKLNTLELLHNERAADLLFPFLNTQSLNVIQVQCFSAYEITEDEITKVHRFLNSQQNLKKLYVDSSFNAIFERIELADTLDLKVEKLSVELLNSFDRLKFLRKQHG